MKPPAELSRELLDTVVEMIGESGRQGTFPVQGQSMIPTLLEGQRVLVEFSPERPARGDMLLFRQANYLVVHRLLGPTRFPDGRPSWRTRGDGLLWLDPHVPPQNVLGRVVAIGVTPEVWRSVRTRRGRLYGRCLAWHDLFWAAAGVIGQRTDALFARIGLRTVFRGIALRGDRWSLRLFHTLLFRAVHPRIDPPGSAVPGTADAKTAP